MEKENMINASDLEKSEIVELSDDNLNDISAGNNGGKIDKLQNISLEDLYKNGHVGVYLGH
ncbi:MAG: hypothetical protein MJ247_01640 [Alphaproteobacteria bacterium]|nr:hypothetical protein [Alphaproteobacteria bacterium]